MLCCSAILLFLLLNKSGPGSLAGAEGFEPPKAVLETAGLPLAYAPTNSGQGPADLSVTLAFRSKLPLLNLLMGMVLAAERAELLHLQPFRGRLLVLHAGVVFTLALGALKCDLFARHIAQPLFENFTDSPGAD